MKRIQVKRVLFWTTFYVALISIVVGFVIYLKSHENLEHKQINGEFSLSMSKQRYKKGEVVSFSLANNSGDTLKVDNNCPEEPMNVYFWSKGQWQRKHSHAQDKICEGQKREINIMPNTLISGSYSKWMDLFEESGLYRIAVFVHGYSGIVYQDIEILPEEVPVKSETTNNNSQTKPPAAIPAQTNPNIPEDDHEDQEREFEDEKEDEKSENETDN